MPLINDLILELEVAEVLEAGRVAGGSDLLDIQAGASTLTPETIAVLQVKLAHETEQLSLITRALSALNDLAVHGYPVRKIFDVAPQITDELAAKQKAMAEFASELRPILVGSDGGTISIVAQTQSEPAVVAKKKGK